MKPILLFDIDGTLLHIRRPFLEGVIEQILTELNVSRDHLKNRSFAGRTDKDIFSDLVGGTNEPELFSRLKELYVGMMESELSAEHVELIPGAEEAVHFAAENDYHVGLCTGNFREVAFRKVEAAGFEGVFRFGGFGCDHEDRIHLPGEADSDFRSVTGESAEPQQYIVIGDTPNDIRCARHFGARALAVTTGDFARETLKPHQPDLILDSLGEPKSWFGSI